MRVLLSKPTSDESGSSSFFTLIFNERVSFSCAFRSSMASVSMKDIVPSALLAFGRSARATVLVEPVTERTAVALFVFSQ